MSHNPTESCNAVPCIEGIAIGLSRISPVAKDSSLALECPANGQDVKEIGGLEELFNAHGQSMQVMCTIDKSQIILWWWAKLHRLDLTIEQ